VLSVAGTAWLGWAQAGPPWWWVPFLTAGSAIGVVLAVASVLLARRHRRGPSAMTDPRSRRRYVTAVAVEAAACAAGSSALGAGGSAPLIPAWILFVVGVHFVPLALVFRIRGLQLTGVLCALVAVLAVPASLSGVLPASAVAGAGGGLVMLAGAVPSLLAARHPAEPVA